MSNEYEKIKSSDLVIRKLDAKELEAWKKCEEIVRRLELDIDITPMTEKEIELWKQTKDVTFKLLDIMSQRDEWQMQLISLVRNILKALTSHIVHNCKKIKEIAETIKDFEDQYRDKKLEDWFGKELSYAELMKKAKEVLDIYEVS
jgi:hypothetical protein